MTGQRLQPKVGIVTGATQAMGEAIATHLSQAGFAICGVGRSRERGCAVAERLRARGGAAAFVQADIGIDDEVSRAVDFTMSHFGRVDVVVNNAAALDADNGETAVDALSTETFDRIIKVGLYAPLWFAKYTVPHMIAGGMGGSFISISSYAGSLGVPGLPAYSASKGGLEALTRQIAAEYGHYGIRANTLVLGSIHVPRNDSIHGDPAKAELSRRGRMIARVGTPDDVGAAVAYLASDEAGFITGASIPVDGGLLSKAPAVSMAHGVSREPSVTNVQPAT
jgi:NAD(P)-dependent dehydrogenase (short-subunit alcohol dehydrogenase family)